MDCQGVTEAVRTLCGPFGNTSLIMVQHTTKQKRCYLLMSTVCVCNWDTKFNLADWIQWMWSVGDHAWIWKHAAQFPTTKNKSPHNVQLRRFDFEEYGDRTLLDLHLDEVVWLERTTCMKIMFRHTLCSYSSISTLLLLPPSVLSCSFSLWNPR